MFLRKVYISGFKSYSEEVSVDFKHGICVIVGNNGVGKSNILDAIAWALGERDPYRLRCGSNKDIFFSGTEDYLPAQTARVELHLESQQQNEMPLIITRQLELADKNSFYVDRIEVPEQIYQQKLDAVGMTDTVKTLIRQEQINQFIHMNGDERYNYLVNLLGAYEITEELILSINNDFKNFFKILIPEGDAEIFHSTNNHVNELRIKAAFKGKRMRDPIQLSGGEKTVCSLSLILAIFEKLKSPFYLFDEVEPSLDWTNHHQMQTLLKILAEKRQLLMITHLRSTIDLADTLHGIRARRDGSSFVKFYYDMDDRLLRRFNCC